MRWRHTGVHAVFLPDYHIVAILLLLPTLRRFVAASAAANTVAISVAAANAAAISTECSYVLGILFFLSFLYPNRGFGT